MLQIQRGTPPAEGRYVAFVQCASRQVPEWCEPVIATWQGDRWHCGKPVFGWIGPLPVAQCFNLRWNIPPLEYDL